MTEPKLTRWQRLKVWWHARKLRRVAKFARRYGLTVLDAEHYRATVDKLVDLAAFVDQSGALPNAPHARAKLKLGLRVALERLALGEKLGSEKHFLETLRGMARRRYVKASRREVRAARRHLVDAVDALNRRLEAP